MMKMHAVKWNIKLFFVALLSLFLLTHTHGNAQVRVHTYLDGIGALDDSYTDAGLAIEIEKQFDVDYSASIGLGYREHINWKDDGYNYIVNWSLLEIPVGLKYYIHPSLGVQLLVAPRFITSSPSGYAMGSAHDVGAQTTPLFNTNVSLMVITGGSFLGLFSLPKRVTVGAGLRYNVLPQSVKINDPDSGEHNIKEHAVGFTLRAGITLFSLKRKKL